jgi:hypothetical protein
MYVRIVEVSLKVLKTTLIIERTPPPGGFIIIMFHHQGPCAPDDPYYRLGPVHTCLYARVCRLVTGTCS